MPGASNALNVSESGYVVFDGVSDFVGRTFQAGTGISLLNPDGTTGDTIISSTGTVAITYTENTGTATPTNNNLNVLGDETLGITTTGSGFLPQFHPQPNLKLHSNCCLHYLYW